MKKYVSFLLVLFVSLFLFLPAHAQQRKSVAVVLSGGGAKGVAHIGALKVIEEAGIPIDYIVGTSMGSIIGGLYSIGYTPCQLDSMVNHQNWSFLLSDRISWEDQTMTERKNSETYILSVPLKKDLKANVFGGVIKGQNLGNLFSELTVGYHDSINFNKLPIPFACVSENIVNGEEVVFHNGVLATAMRASMAIPGVFTPVRMGDEILVDGGMKNNFPTNIARAMGADVIIGVDVQNDLRTADELNNLGEIFNQIINLTGQTRYEENIKLATVYIKVDVKGYSAASFNIPALDTLMHRGEEAARAQWTALRRLKKEIGLPEDYVAPRHGPFTSLWSEKDIFVKEITFDGIEDSDKKWIMHRCHLKENSRMRMEQLYEALATLRGSQAYSNVSYKLTDTDQGYLLHFILEEKYERNLNLGIRFDSEEIASLLLNVSTRLNTRIPSWLSLTGRLGKRYLARVDYTLAPMQMRNFNLAYQFEYNDINIYDHGKRAYNTTYKYHSGELGFSDVWYRNLRFGAGLRFEFFKYKDFLYNAGGQQLKVKPQYFFSYYAQLHYNTYDKGYFPSKGIDLQGNYSLYTDNLTQYKGHAPFSALTASWASVFSVTDRFALIPSLYGRILIGKDIPYPYLNAIGGDNFGHYLPQQLPFAGITNLEIVDNSVIIAGLKVRQRIGGKNYVTLTGNVALREDNFFDILSGKPVWGGSLGYGYDSLFGPLEASFGYSSRAHDVGFYVNLGYVF
ncbi:patatin-like phospholipase family protein [Bacteroides fragilis]|uniref:patatin-like phospholipase family protein n=1 Tax=Bacteroides fragilis TaxID=817 RepID=UPI00202FA5D0|nr:patatin-like phospholipase family protein [Bacteroides fragilis]MCM0343038.1 patatin-like phospholipase family protein [Bacteroides fragilis]